MHTHPFQIPTPCMHDVRDTNKPEASARFVSQEKSDGQKGGGGGMFKGLIDTIIGNLQLSISNIHVRYEVSQGTYHAHLAVSTARHCACMHPLESVGILEQGDCLLCRMTPAIQAQHSLLV